MDFHRHTGSDSPKIKYIDLEDISTGTVGKLTIAGTQSINNQSETLVNFDTSVIALGITVDTTNKKMTVLTAGKYLISAKIGYSATVDNKSYQMRIKKNGSQIAIAWITSAVPAAETYYNELIISDVFDLAVNDYIEIYAYHIAGVAQTIDAVGSGYFTMAKV